MVAPLRAAAGPAVVAAVAAVALAGAVAAWSVASAREELVGFVALAAAVAVGLLVFGLVAGVGGLVGSGVAVLLAAYGLCVLGADDAVRADAVVVGPALWLAVEAGWWSLEARRPLRAAPGLVAGRIARLAATAVASSLVGLVLLDLGATGVGGGPLLKAAGAAAALALVGLVAGLARVGAS